MNKIITIHQHGHVRFCMTDSPEKEYKVISGDEVLYTHWDFDIAVKEYEITRKLDKH